MEPPAMKAAARAANQSAADAVTDLARRIYENPELSNQEHRASQSCREMLDAGGFTVEDVSGVPTAFVAEYVGDVEGPTVGLLAEYDALPEIGHGCGHHLIAGSAVGAGLALAAVDGLPGRVKIFGCPAEELGTGKLQMTRAGAFEGVDVGLTFHAYHSTSVMTSSNGVRQWDFTFHGKASHAATDPWAGFNALDGVLLTYQNINALRQFVRDGVRIHGFVTHGGDAFNVIPERASCRLAVRSTGIDELERVVRRTLDCAEAAALASGTRLEVVEGQQLDPVRYNPPLGDAVAANLRAIGEDVVDWPALASTDFGNVSWKLPAILFSAATWPASVAFHTREATEYAGAPKAFTAMLTGADAMALTTIDLMTDPELLRSVQSNFKTPSHEGAV